MERRRNLGPLGFTLIELLIVVAIIAILAAIAVPNFLEAQIRAKISRVKADQRSFAVAVESYSVDWNGVPLGDEEGDQWQPQHWGLTAAQATFMQQAKMTTPIAYMTSIMKDPFSLKGQTANVGGGPEKNTGLLLGLYYYESIVLNVRQPGGDYMGNRFRDAWALGGQWVIWSRGPSKRRSGVATGEFGMIRYLGKIPDIPTQPRYPSRAYDPTNGTMSWGHVFRSNHGVGG